jgi:hypothetical protein
VFLEPDSILANHNANTIVRNVKLYHLPPELNASDHLWDVGANVGVYSCLAGTTEEAITIDEFILALYD